VQVTNAELEVALTQACDVTTDVMADRSIPLRTRVQQIGARFRNSEHKPTLDAFFESEDVEPSDRDDHPEHIQWERIVIGAERQGVPGFQCPAMERMLTLLAAGDDDVDPSLTASFADDLGRMCQVAGEPLPDDIGDDMRSHMVAQRIDEAITNPTLREVFRAIASAEASRRYEFIRHAAREEGVPDWSCPALEQFLSGG